MSRALTLAVSLLLVAACAPAQDWKAQEWKAADQLFHSDPRWLGADAAYTIPLDNNRVLWLFGDTFIGDGKTDRAHAYFIRTSIGVQQGLNPAEASVVFHWRTVNGQPSSYFPATAHAWLWPLQGIYRNGALTLFMSKLLPSDTGLHFEGIGSTALRCENLADAPEYWKFRGLATPHTPTELDRLLYGVAVIADDTHVFAYCVDEVTDKAFLVRWSIPDFDRGDLGAPEWWDGGRFSPTRELRGQPAAVFGDAATEFSVQHLPDGRYLQVQTLGFGATDIGARYAPRPEGPWSAPEAVYHPTESHEKDVFVYAAKAHPELEGAPLIVTYAANHFDPAKLLASQTLYYPRFVRLTPRAPGGN